MAKWTGTEGQDRKSYSDTQDRKTYVPVGAKCPECGRVFDLTNEVDADEWYSGHDCEEES